MTVSSTSNRTNYTAGAGQVNFDYTFPCYDKTHMKVYSGGVLKTVDVDYTIDLSLKRVTFMVAPGAGVTVILLRQVPLSQLTDYVAHDSFPAETHERALDLLCMMAQQANEAINRVVKVPVTSLLTNLEIPEGQTKVIGWNAAGTALMLYSVVVDVGVITTKGDTVRGDASGNPERLPIGNNGDLSVVAAGNTAWAAPSTFKLDDWGVPDDNTDLNASATRHGLLPKLPNDTSKFFRGDGVYAVPPTGVRGGFSNLQIFPTVGENFSHRKLTIQADSVVLEDVGGAYYEAKAVNVNADLGVSGAGGLDTGSVAVNTWYFVWLIYNPGTVTVNGLLSTSSSAPTMPSGYTFKKLLGAIRNIGMVSHLHMDGDDEGTTFTDQSGKTWTARNHANTEQSDKKFGTASCELDGTDDYIDTPDHADFTLSNKDFTLECWVKFAGAGATMYRLCGQGAGASADSSIQVFRDSDNYLKGAIYDGASPYAAISSATFTDTASWHHIAFVRRGGLIRFFVDGVAGTAVAANITCVDAATTFSIGRWGSFAGNYFPGKVDEFSLVVGLAKYWSDFTPETQERANLCQILPFTQIDRDVQLSYPHKVANDAGSTTTASLSLATVIPTIARGVWGKVMPNGNITWIYNPVTFPNSLPADNNFTIESPYLAVATGALKWGIPILTEAQTMYHQVSSGLVDIWVGGFNLKGV